MQVFGTVTPYGNNAFTKKMDIKGRGGWGRVMIMAVMYGGHLAHRIII